MDLVSFTEEILNGKLRFLYSVSTLNDYLTILTLERKYGFKLKQFCS